MTFVDFCQEHSSTIKAMIQQGKFTPEKLEILQAFGFKMVEDEKK
jgi:hypothetical protein